MNQQKEAAKQTMIEWLSDEHELGKAPFKIECVNEFDLYDLHYYVFRFKKSLFGEWLLGVCGGYEKDGLQHCGHVYSAMEKYNPENAIDSCLKMVEMIREYWIKQARKTQMQQGFEANLKYISQTTINAEDINRQFMKTENRYYLKAGEIDCPTGRIITADPLCYLPANKYCPELNVSIPAGTYPVEVSICRNELTGIRMCSARLKIKDSKAVKYVLSKPTKESAIATGKEGILSGFPVEAGMMTICDVQTAKEYREFLDAWYQQNPDGNHYDDYFASYFAQSYEKLPAYQREGGDFIEWVNPDTKHKMVMIASGFGDGFYQSFWGYDKEDEICELLVPMINPDLFENDID